MGAKDSVEEFKRQEGVVRKEVESMQRESQNLFALRRQALEGNLTLLEARTADMLRRNSKVQAHIEELANITGEQRATAKRWQTSNDFLREALSALQQKMQVVQEFLVESVNSTDSDGVRELEVLQQQTTPRPTVESFLRLFEGQDDDAHGEVSLLSTENVISAGTQLDAQGGRVQLQQGSQSQQKPGDVGLPDLSKHIQALAEAESQGEAQMVGQYIARQEVERERFLKAQADGRALLTREEELVNTTKSLKLAVAHLKEVHTDLRRRVHGMRRFAVHTLVNADRSSKLSSQTLADAMVQAAAARDNSTTATAAANTTTAAQ